MQCFKLLTFTERSVFFMERSKTNECWELIRYRKKCTLFQNQMNIINTARFFGIQWNYQELIQSEYISPIWKLRNRNSRLFFPESGTAISLFLFHFFNFVVKNSSYWNQYTDHHKYLPWLYQKMCTVQNHWYQNYKPGSSFWLGLQSSTHELRQYGI